MFFRDVSLRMWNRSQTPCYSSCILFSQADAGRKGRLEIRQGLIVVVAGEGSAAYGCLTSSAHTSGALAPQVIFLQFPFVFAD